MSLHRDQLRVLRAYYFRTDSKRPGFYTFLQFIRRFKT